MAKHSETSETVLSRALRRLSWKVRLSQAYLGLERVANAFWPLWTLALVGFVAVWFGLFEVLTPVQSYCVMGLFALGALAALYYGARRFSLPDTEQAVARIDDYETVRPASALRDTQATGESDPAARALWERHMERMAERADALKVPPPDLRLAKRDPWGLRLVALTGFFAALLFARGSDVSSFIGPDGNDLDTLAGGPSFEIWAAPPLYTGKPVLYLGDIPEGTRVLVPEGTEITVRYYGAAENFALSETVSGTATTMPDETSTGVVNTVMIAAQTGDLSLSENGDVLGAWTLDVVEDNPPTIALAEELSRTPEGAMELKYTASDDYGVVGATVHIDLARDEIPAQFGFAVDPIPRAPIVLDLPLPFAGGLDQIEESMIEDLAQHPWAGLPVTVTLTARDEAGQEGTYGPEVMEMPGRRFFDPLAGSLAEQRRDLLWSPENVTRVSQLIRTLTHRPSENFKSSSAYLIVRTALRRLGYAAEDGYSAAEIEDVAGFLWRAALLIEEGDLASALERLRQAQDRLEEAIENGATQEEIARLMQELEDATNEYMRQLARQQQQDGEQQQAGNQQDGQQLNQDILDQMREEIERLFNEGRTEEAQRLLEEYRRMMENMRVTQQQGGGQGEGQQQGQQAMEDLQETLREQQDLSDDAFRELQRMFEEQRRQQQQQQGQQQGQQGQQGQQQGQQGQQQGQQQGNGEDGQGEGRQQQGAQREGQSGQQSGQQQGQSGQNQNGQGGNNRPSDQSGQGQMSAEQLAQRQEALRQLLDELRDGIPQGGGEGADPTQSLDRADRDMGAARDNLEQGDLPEAIDRQADAMDAMREAIQALGQQLREQAMQDGQDGQGQANTNPTPGNIDPLGRPMGENGQMNTNDSLLGDTNDVRRSRELQEEIRRRSGEVGRSEQELEYLRRLLERF